MKFLCLLAPLLLAACSSKKTRLDCVEICRERGMKFVEVVEGPVGFDHGEQKLIMKDACRCR